MQEEADSQQPVPPQDQGAGSQPEAAAKDEARPPEGVQADDPAARCAELGKQLQQAEAKAHENWERFLRATAEQDNIRKRAEREVEAARRFALEKFAGDLLPVCDSLELGLKAASEAGAQASHIEGIELTLKMFNEMLNKHSIETINPQGELFDPEKHEAMTAVPTADASPNSIIEVLQRGFSLNGRVLRPARVVVAKAVEPGGA